MLMVLRGMCKKPSPKLKKYVKLWKNLKSPFIRLHTLRSLETKQQHDYYNGCYSVRGIRRGTRGDFEHNGNFYDAIGPVLVMAQFFCLMPVRGIKSKSARSLSFCWKSFRTCYCVLYVFTTTFDTVLTLNMVFKGDLDVRNMEPLIFHFSIMLASVQFLRLASKWPKLMLKWENIEQQMPQHENWQERGQLARRIKLTTIVLITLSLAEHLLSTLSAIHFSNYCPARKDNIEAFFTTVLSQIFLVIDYSPWLAFLGKLQNVLMTFGWSYMDIFVMIMGMGLSSLFERVQRSMERVKGQVMSESYWNRTRLQYRLICDLIEEVDSAISGITMLSFANNLYFVCIQLLKSMNKMPSSAHAVYFYFSLMFLLGRTLAVCFYLAEVHDRSRNPLPVLKHVPPSSYYTAVERFANEVATDITALTGLRFFNITRKLIVTVAGTIITYELVLIQFHEDQQLWNCGEED